MTAAIVFAIMAFALGFACTAAGCWFLLRDWWQRNRPTK